MTAVIAAIDEEVHALLELMEHPCERQMDKISFWEGSIKGHAVVLMRSGVGKVNAAMAATLLMKYYHPKAVINIGTAGGLCDDERVLDLVIGKTIVQYDYDTSYVDGEEGIGRYFTGDETLCRLCETICDDLQERFHSGLIASGDQFVGREDQLRQLLARFPEAKCAEMESGAIAQVCTHFRIPFVIVRSLSDIAFQKKSNLSFLEYAAHAGKRSAVICAALIEQLA